MTNAIQELNELILKTLYKGWEEAADRLAEVEEDIKESARLDGRQVITYGEYAERNIEYNFTAEELDRLAKAEREEQLSWELYEKTEKEIKGND